MTCERCTDIHKAQNIGITYNPCACKCHDDPHSISITGDENVTILDKSDDRVEIQADGSFK